MRTSWWWRDASSRNSIADCAPASSETPSGSLAIAMLLSIRNSMIHRMPSPGLGRCRIAYRHTAGSRVPRAPCGCSRPSGTSRFTPKCTGCVREFGIWGHDLGRGQRGSQGCSEWTVWAEIIAWLGVMGSTRVQSVGFAQRRTGGRSRVGAETVTCAHSCRVPHTFPPPVQLEIHHAVGRRG